MQVEQKRDVEVAARDIPMKMTRAVRTIAAMVMPRAVRRNFTSYYRDPACGKRAWMASRWHRLHE